ncbi:MAG TPA: helix-turn-helix domain-containing protein [Acidimicrobiales bacterium]|nr:helix-turn-helix domain-containing protein [Acidimicrobiales bacterium]
MVYLHALEHDVDPPRVSTDIDVAVDVRSDPKGIAKVVGVLLGLGFTPAGESPEGHLHRFEKHNAAGRAVVDLAVDEAEFADDSGPPTGSAGSVAVDVLAPEGAGRRANLRTVGRATAFPAKGVTQALRRTQLLPVAHSGSVAWIPRPDLLGAIVLKAVAADVDQADKERHLIDLGFLCGLVGDPFEMAELAPLRPAEGDASTVAPLLLRPEEAAAVLGIGRSTLYELLAAGAVESVLIGKSRRVPVAALDDYVVHLRAMQGQWTHAHARRAARGEPRFSASSAP